jgi:hypothetical protein
MTALARWGGDFAHEHAAGLVLTGTTLTFDATTKRTGSRSFKFSASAANYLTHTFTKTLGRGYYFCGHFLIPAASGLPGSNAIILDDAISATSAFYNVTLTSGGKLRLGFGTTPTQIGSDSAATIAVDTWYRVEFFSKVGSGSSDDSAELRLDGVTVASETNQTRFTNASTQVRFGWITDPGTAEDIHWDDLGLNDDQGSVNNTWLGDTKVYTSFPASDNARTNWVDGAGGTTGLFGSVDNVPPTGVATASSGATNQVENAVSAAAAAYDANMQDYTTLGIGAGDTIQCIIPVVEIGSSSTTGSDTITHSVVSNPAIAGTTSSCDIVAGTYPASWNRFTGVITEAPTVTKGNQPVMRIAKDVATTRINACALMALVVAVTPGVAPTAARYRSIMMVGD